MIDREEILQRLDIAIGTVLEYAKRYSEYGCDGEAKELMGVAADLQFVGNAIAFTEAEFNAKK